MSLIDAIHTRVSTRAYSDAPVTGAEINALLRAAVRAPTAMHGEPWVFVIIQDRALLDRIDQVVKGGVLAKALAIHMLPADYAVFHGAGTLIAIGTRKFGPFIEADCWLAAENLMLAATAAGLGTCCIGSAVGALNEAGIRAELGLPDDVRVIVPIVVGHPLGTTPPASRRDPEIALWRS